MAIRNIVKQGDSCLEKVCRPVTEFNARLHMLLDDMRETLAAADGASWRPQVGVLRRAAIIVDGEGGYLELINPEILDQQGSQEGAEGCLSVPGRYGIVERPQKITIKFQDRTGAERQLELEDFLARAACHETDHLEGKLYLRLVTRFLEPEEVEA